MSVLRFSALGVLLSVFWVSFTSCDTTSSSGYEPIEITGKVTDTSNDPIANAIVRIVNPRPEQTTTTDEDGLYLFTAEVDSSMKFTIEAHKEGYQAQVKDFLAIPERDAELPVFRLSLPGEEVDDDETIPDDGETKGSAFITLESISEETIQVYETGGTETSKLLFMVTDSAGTPVSGANEAMVHFEISSGPDGGESIYPDSARTSDGMVEAALTSGTVAGAVQVRVYFSRDGHTMESKTVSLSISGGLPDDNHFEVSAESKNIAAAASETEVTALVGDKYGNTVAEGTAVYFGTDKGVITGSTTTDAEGYATSTLKTNNAEPGPATVRVETVDENGNRLRREIDMLYSGVPQMSITPETLDLEKVSSQTFSVVLHDEKGQPLSAGTNFMVELENNDLVLSGDNEVTLQDHLEPGPGATEFEFTVSNPRDVKIYEDSTLTVRAEGPNGSISRKLFIETSDEEITEPGSIYLENITETDIAVRGTGGQREDARITFAVVDVNGNPLNENNNVQVSFRLGNNPGGDIRLTEGPVLTDSEGFAETTITSGTSAGAVQVIAEITKSNGSTIRSQPVRVVIHGGLPSQEHFTLALGSRNVASDMIQNVPVTAFAGDRYGNEAQDGSAVYFTTSGGFVEGSAYTSGGEATANLTVSNPIPSDGIATITASTTDEDQQEVTASSRMIFSGSPIITVTPESFDIPNADDQQFNFTVSDHHGHPMAPGTSITVTAEGDEIELIGDINISVGSPNSEFSNLDQLTNYTFFIDDADPEEVNDTPAIITIEVSGDNGSARKTITGRKAKTIAH